MKNTGFHTSVIRAFLGAAVLAAFASTASAYDTRGSSFSADASSVGMNGIEPSYCSSIDGVDYSARQYFKGPDEVTSLLGLAIKERTASGVCCTAAKVLTGGVCSDPAPTAASCASQGLVLLAGRCVLAAPEPCPVAVDSSNEDWFAGRFEGVDETPPSIPGITVRMEPFRIQSYGLSLPPSEPRTHRFFSDGTSVGFARRLDYTYKFNVTDTQKVGEFAITRTSGYGHFLLEINDKAVFAGPASIWMRQEGVRAFPMGASGLLFVSDGDRARFSGSSAYIFSKNANDGVESGIVLLRKNEYTVMPQAISTCRGGVCSTVTETRLVLQANPNDIFHEFIGLPLSPFIWAASDGVIGGSSYQLRRSDSNFWCGSFECGWSDGVYVHHAHAKSNAKFLENPYHDVKQFLVNGENRIKIKWNVGTIYSLDAFNLIIKASIQNAPSCQR